MKKITFTYLNLSLWTWVKVMVSIATLSGCTSALFLFLLQLATATREKHLWLLFLLPLAGLTIVYLYRKYGQVAKKGNNLLLDEYYSPRGIIPWVMAPLILVSTLITHLFGGSAGREGTAIQYGGTFADKIASFFALDKTQNRVALMAGVAAGFASLFGTPLAGTIFALEVFKVGPIRAKALPVVAVTAYLSHFLTLVLQAPHSHYKSVLVNTYFDQTNLWVIVVALLCGLTARLFLLSGSLWTLLFKSLKNEYYRIIAGSFLLLALLFWAGTTRYIGLGLPTIAAAFESPATSYDFILKIVFTTLTLSIGFKGGEVTPLFFIGATLMSFLSLYIPLPISILAALGFVSVFAGATKAPLACALMALELFGWQVFPFALVSCYIAVWISGKKGIYSSQRNFGSWL